MKNSQLLVFTSFMLLIGLACRLSDRSLQDFNTQSTGMVVWLLSPFVLMLIFRAINKDWKSFGTKLQLRKSWGWYIFSLALYPIVIALLLSIGKVTHTIEFGKPLSAMTKAALASLIPMIVKNIFEELGEI